jgi:hypothetical protein
LKGLVNQHSNATCNLFHDIDATYINSLPTTEKTLLYKFLKDKSPDANENVLYQDLVIYLRSDEIVGRILREFQEMIGNCVIGLLETGDLLFMFANETRLGNFFAEQRNQNNLEARLRYEREDPTKWILEIDDYRNNRERPYQLEFNVPLGLLSQWKAYNFDKTVGYNLKGEFFSRIFIFSQRASNYGLPFTLINLDSQWLENLTSDN